MTFPYLNHPLIAQILAENSSPNTRIWVEGLRGSSRSLFLTAWAQEHPLCCIAQDKDEAGYLYHDIVALETRQKVVFFPSSFLHRGKYDQKDEAFEVMRTELLADLAMGQFPIIVTYPEALAEAVESPRAAEGKILRFHVGEEVERTQLIEQLIHLGFSRTDYVFSPGEFAFRGSILDIFSHHTYAPYRLDFMDDEIESIRHFDPENQLSTEELTEATLVGKIHSGEKKEGLPLIELIGKDYDVWMAHTDFVVQKILSTAQEIAEADSRIEVVSPEKVTHAIEHYPRTLLWDRPCEQWAHHKHYTFRTAPQAVYGRNIDLLFQDLERYHEKGYQVYFLSDIPSQGQRMGEIVREKKALHLLPEVLPISLHEGFEDLDGRMLFLTDHQIFDRFHKYQLKSDKVRNAQAAFTLKDLESLHSGDYIVHLDHGIGKFLGLITTEISGKKQEVVKIQFHGGDIVLVGLHNLHKISKYRSGDEEVEPKLNRLGNTAWQRIKERTKKKVKDIARELIVLYAQRKEKAGFAFSPDSYLQHALEASFIFEETEDQLRATQEVKRDMESPRPMDRLICGDVGFGKTEVAIRAAFKAVADSKQVAVLVPTTILAYQHYLSFSARMQELPVHIEYLSRARTAKEIKETLARLLKGEVDIIIGTHRLVSKDVLFKDLGLLIIDEEQKFGVSTKEKIRQMQVEVDTLTLTATPIPRTLQFSLMGARDLSNINTPPKNRHPVSTRVVRFSTELIQEAVENELSRNGQVYIVHNRIQDLHILAGKVAQAVPQARIAVGHGQMPPAQLEEIVLDFSKHEYDILIATTIVENGIDVGNANTIIIDDAHRYGLSDLHQLRGRVGRSNRKAYCYLITPPLDTLPENARRRVQAVENFSELGSGIRIALQDLDIRGAGNILGAEQSGFIADMGFETYRKVFDEAVREVKYEEFGYLFESDSESRETPLVRVDTQIETDLNLSFPSDYIPEDYERIRFYRKIDEIENDSEEQTIRKTLKDRFGALPSSVLELLLVPRLRQSGGRLGVPKITIKQETLTLFLPPDHQDPYYDSPEFAHLIAYAAQHHRTCEIKENTRGQRLVKVLGIVSIEHALNTMHEIENQPLGSSSSSHE